MKTSLSLPTRSSEVVTSNTNNIQGPLKFVKILLHLACDGLEDLDIASKSDPQIIVYQRDPGSKEKKTQTENDNPWNEIDKTETIKNNSNPRFIKPIVVEYHFEEWQPIKFLVLDIDKANGKIEDQDYIGEFECDLAEIITSTETLKKPLYRVVKNEREPLKSFILIHSEQIKSNSSKVNFKFSAEKLEKKDFGLFGGLSDPYLKLSQKTTDSQSDWLAFYKNDPIKKTLTPDWPEFEIGIDFVCNGDYNREIKIECYDWDEIGAHSLIGECTTTVSKLLAMEKNCKVDLINPEEKEKKKKI